MSSNVPPNMNSDHHTSSGKSDGTSINQDIKISKRANSYVHYLNSNNSILDELNIKILFLSSRVKQAPQHQVDEEIREINNSLIRSKKRNLLKLENREILFIEDIHRSILDTEPTIVHISGPRKIIGSSSENNEDKDVIEGILFQNKNGDVENISLKQISEIFQALPNQLECVILNVNYSQENLNSISLSTKNLIGISQEISSESSIKFSTAFYDALGAGKDILFAFRIARSQLVRFGQEHIPEIIKLEKLDKSDEVESFENEPSSRLDFALIGSIDEMDKGKLKAISNALKKLTNDDLIEIVDVHEGSIHLLIEGSKDSLEIIEYLVNNGYLSHIIDIPIQSASLVNRMKVKVGQSDSELSSYQSGTQEEEEEEEELNRIKRSAIQLGNSENNSLTEINNEEVPVQSKNNQSISLTSARHQLQIQTKISSPISSSEEIALNRYISYLLSRYNRYFLTTIEDIYNECILRYFRARRQNKTIDSKLYWMKGIAFNIIFYELYREGRKLGQTYDPQVLQEIEAYPDIAVVNDDPLDQIIKHDLIKQALMSLNDEDQLILRLHYFQTLPWDVIHSFYEAKTGHSVKENTLRQRYSRAYKRLLKKLTELWDESE